MLVRFLRLLVVAAVCAAASSGSDESEKLFKEGQRAERMGDKLHAYLLYARAAALEPTNVTYAARKAALQAIAEITSETRLDTDPADAGHLKQRPPEATRSGEDLLDLREALPPPSLVGS